MIEVFKTNVRNRSDAVMVIAQIHKIFMDYKANFDLEDCDKILRVKSTATPIKACQLIGLLNNLGFQAEVLPDEKPLVKEIHIFERKYYPVFE